MTSIWLLVSLMTLIRQEIRMYLLIQSNLHGHRAEHIEHLINTKKVELAGYAIWVNDAEKSSVEDRFQGKEGYLFCQTGPTDSLRLKEIYNTYNNLKVIFLDGDRVLPFLWQNFIIFRNFPTTVLLTRINFPGFKKFRPLVVFWGKMFLACSLQILSIAKIKKMVVLEKSTRKMFGQVRDPLMKPVYVAKKNSNLGSGLKSIGIVGTIDPRKSIHLAAQALDYLGPDFQLKLSGEVTPDFTKPLEILVSHNSKVHVDNRHLSEEEIVEAISGLDCFLVLLQNNLPSGTILRALSLGVPVVVGGAKVLQKVVWTYPNLAVWTDLNPGSIAKSVAKALEMERVPATGLPTPADFASDLLESK